MQYSLEHTQRPTVLVRGMSCLPSLPPGKRASLPARQGLVSVTAFRTDAFKSDPGLRWIFHVNHSYPDSIRICADHHYSDCLSANYILPTVQSNNCELLSRADLGYGRDSRIDYEARGTTCARIKTDIPGRRSCRSQIGVR